MGESLTYTKFPNLYNTIDAGQGIGKLQFDWPGIFLHRDTLILAWATLLQAYTAITSPVFLLDEKAIQVDIERKSWAHVEVEDSHAPHYGYTAVILANPSKRPSLALELHCETSSWSSTLYSSSSVPESFLKHILTQLQHGVAKDAGAGNQSLSTNQDLLLSVVNPRRRILPGPRFLQDLISHASDNAIAIDYLSSANHQVRLSYQDLNCLSDRLAVRIASALATHYGSSAVERIVPVVIPQSPELYIAQVAILKSGASFCPVGTNVPPERLAFIVKDVGARVLVTTRDFTPTFPKTELELEIISWPIDDSGIDPTAEPRQPAGRGQQHGDSIAYVMYTSGSTGLPKGVAISHKAVTQALLAHDEHIPRYARFLQFAAPTFDVSVFEVFFTFYRGATLVTCHREDMLSNLPGVMRNLHVDAAELTPTVAGTLLKAWDAVPCLNLLLTIGEVLPRSVIQKFAQSPIRECILLPMYGPTEASIHSTVMRDVQTGTKAGMIGRPLSTVSAFVIAEDECCPPNVLPIGHVGELALAGQLAQGYINRPGQTAAAFVDLPGYGIIYRTGDRARLLPSGDLECSGRITSDQVKIRGQRVELGEIEQVICRCPDVRLAVASVVDGNLVAFCVPDDGGLYLSAARQAVKEMCKVWLPSFMRPTDVVMLTDDLPRLPSGKVDRYRIANDHLEKRRGTTLSSVSFANDLEASIAESIRGILGIHVDRSEDLWSSGVDSLRAIRLASNLRIKGFHVTTLEILTAETIATLALSMQRSRLAALGPSTLPKVEIGIPGDVEKIIFSKLNENLHADVDAIVPCSNLQQALLSESMIAKKINFNWIKIMVAHSVSVDDFLGAFHRLALANDILRSGFMHIPGHKSHFARIVWRALDPVDQVRYCQSDHTQRSSGNETEGLTLLRPLRLVVIPFADHSIVWLCIHHALYDGWSWDLIMSDLDSLLAGKIPSKRPQFWQYVQFEKEFVSTSDIVAAREYWADHLQKVAVVSLPRLTHKNGQAETCTLSRASRVDLLSLEATSQRLRISRQAIPSAAFATLLSLYCGTPEVVYGSVSSGRTIPLEGIEDLVGPCISTLPVRVNLNNLRTVADLLLHVHNLHHNFLHFGQLPPLDLKKAAGIPSDQALFDTLFVWQESLGRQQNAERALSVIDARDHLSYALILEVEPEFDKLLLKATFDSSVLCADQVNLFLSQFEAALAFYMKSSTTSWREVLGHIEPQDQSIANPDYSQLDASMDISTLIDRFAKTDPERVAIEFVNDFHPLQGTLTVSKVSYGTLVGKANSVCSFLLSLDVVANDLICLFMKKSIQLYISILGVLKAGAAYIVIDPQSPSHRADRVLQLARCRYCLKTADLDSHDILKRFQNIFSYEEIGVSASRRPPPAAPGSDLAYVVFTSGSTGIPKGVEISRCNILSNIDVLSRIYPVVRDGALLQACSPAFDVSVFEILYTWHMGMRLCAASNDVLFRHVERFIQVLNITHLSLTPSMAALISPGNVPSVQVLVTAGEAVSAKVFQDWAGRGLYQGYGPSETTNICSINCDVSADDHINNIGPPLPNTSMFVSTADTFHPLPKGALGEIWVGGDQVGRGYLHETSLTTEVFLDHPEHGKLYRSGDLGRMLPGGSIIFHGRQDEQIKLRGQRIELGEIEHALLKLPKVSDTVCILVEGSREVPTRLVAYWSSGEPWDDGKECRTQLLFDDLVQRLPTYMIPDCLIRVKTLPLTSQGKTDKKALKQLFLTTENDKLKHSFRHDIMSKAQGLVDARDVQVGQAIAAMTGTALSLIDRNSSFISMGLNSINCIGLSRQLLEMGFGQVDVSLILRSGSISKLLRAILDRRDEASTKKRATSSVWTFIDREWDWSVRKRYERKGFHVQKILPCTPLQQAMLSLAAAGGNDAYQNQLSFSVLGDLQQLQAAWETCAAVHEILRTGFVLTPSYEFPYAQVVLADYLPTWKAESHCVRAQDNENTWMMPPYSFSSLKETKDVPPRLTLSIHHALHDAEAMALLLRQVECAYKNIPMDKAVSLQPYLDYMMDLNQEESDEFWHTHLASYSPKLISGASEDLRSTTSSDSISGYAASVLSYQIILDAAKQLSLTVLSLLQLTWTRLLVYYSGERDVCFGNVYSGRTLPIPHVEAIVGPCFNTLPLRVLLAEYETNQQAARKLHDHNLVALRFQPSSLRRIQRRKGAGPVFDSLLLLQAEPMKLDRLIWTLEEESGEMDFPLILEAIPNSKSNQLALLLHAQRELLSEEGARLVLEDFDALLNHAVRYPDALANDFSMLDSEKGSLMIVLSTKTGTKPPLDSQIAAVEQAWSPLEQRVCDILRKIAGTGAGELTRHTTIFHLGLDSINAHQIAAELRRQGYSLSSGHILEAATVGGIASLCEKPEPDDPNQDLWYDFETFNKKHLAKVCHQLSIRLDDVEEIRPCTPFQSGILAEFCRSQGQNYLNNVQYELDEDVDLSNIEYAWKMVTLRHDVLRSGFVDIEDIKSPFAMVLYASESDQVSWWDQDIPQLPKHGDGAISLHDALHKPPWRVYISQAGMHKTMHISILHALYDARTFEIILEDLALVYRGKTLPKVAPIKPCLSRILQNSSSQASHTASALSNVSNAAATPFPDLHSHQTEDLGFYTSVRDCSASLSCIKERCRKAGVTLQVAGQCAWARLLSAYTGEPLVAFGIVVSGRLSEAEEDVAFPCIRTVPISAHPGNSTNRVLLERAMQHTGHILKNPFAPLDSRSGSESYLSDTLYVLQHIPRHSVPPPWKVVADDAKANYAISVELLPRQDDELHVRLTFRKRSIPLEQGRLMLQQFDALLLNTLENLDADASQYINVSKALMSIAPAREPLISTDVKYLHEFVGITARQCSNKIALEFVSDILDGMPIKRSWTYGDLDAKSNEVAHLLQENGVQAGELVGVCFDKCPEASFTLVGISKIGCAFVALDPNAPDSRKRFIVEDCGCRILCTTRATANSLEPMAKLRVLSMDELLGCGGLPSTPPKLSRALSGKDICYCLYTSGTTGTPKGCLITHTNAVQFVLAFQRLFSGHWDVHSRFLQFASFHFDVSVMEQFWSWSIGICVTSAPRDLLFQDLSGAIRALQITHLDLTPSLARLLTPDECPSLCRGAFITGGEKLRQEIIDAWGDKAVVYNGYGPSEVTIGCTMYARVPRSVKPSNIGPAYDNVGAFVLDLNTKSPVLRGAVGELCVSGPLVGKGYLNRPELTASKFEYLQELQVRIYHTGDLVRLLHDGSFSFIGRADDQVKLRGQRLEIGEIDHVVLQASAEIKDVATTVLKQGDGSAEQLVSFIALSGTRTKRDDIAVALHPSHQSLIDQVRTVCHRVLPDYMVPSYIIPVNAMPLSATNKIDSKRLQLLFQATSQSSLQAISAASDPPDVLNSLAMKSVIEAVSKITRVSKETIRTTSRLFELGIDSVSVIYMSRLLREAGFNSASPSMLMQNSMIRNLVAALKEPIQPLDGAVEARHEAEQDITAFSKRHSSTISEVLNVEDDDIEKIAPCTPLQEGMIAESLKGDSAAYLSSFTFALNSSLDTKRLHAAWEHVKRENQILRTRFVPTIDGYAQVVLESRLSPFTSQQVSIDDGRNVLKNIEEGFRRWCDQMRRLEGEPWTVTFYRTPKEALMVFDIFHGLYDGISMVLMLQEIVRMYHGNHGPQAKPSYHEVLPYGPLLSAVGARAFWTEHLRNIRLLRRPLQHTGDSPVAASYPMPASDNVKRLREELDVTNAAIFHACWLLSLQLESEISPTIGLVVSGRALEVDGVENVVGPLFNTIPCQIEMDPSTTLPDLVKACHLFNTKAMAYQHTPLSKISKWLKRKTSDPLFDCLFVFQREAGDPYESRKLWKQIATKSKPLYPLVLEIEERLDHSFVFTIFASGEYFTQGEVQTLLTRLKDCLSHVLVRPTKSAASACHNYPPVNVGGTDDGLYTRVEPKEKGVNGTITRRQEYQWDDVSAFMRSEIAKLAAVETQDVSPFMSIFELGLDSIDAIKLSARFKAAKILLPISTILQAASIATMRKKIMHGKDPSKGEHKSFGQVKEDLRRTLIRQGIDGKQYQKVLPVTPLQESMLANYGQYHSQDVLRISDEVDVGKLQHAWRMAVSAHDILRTSFVQVDDMKSAFTYAQLVCSNVSLQVSSTTLNDDKELQGLLSTLHDEAGQRGIGQFALQLTLVNMAGTMFLILGMPHALYDGWSISLLHQDVARYYHGLDFQRPSYEPFLEHSLRAVSKTSRSFWSKVLMGCRPKRVAALPCAEREGKATNRHELSSKIPANQLVAFCRERGVTLQSLGLVCWALILAHHLKSRDVCFGLVLAGRDTEDADEMMFPTMNTVPFRMVLEGSKLDVVKSAHELSAAISEHQHFPLRQIKALVGDFPDPLFDTLFIYQKKPADMEILKPLYHSVTTLSEPEYPVNIEMEVRRDDLVWRAACRDGGFDGASPSMMLHMVDTILGSILREPSEPVSKPIDGGTAICGLPAFGDWVEATSTKSKTTSTLTNADGHKSKLEPMEEILARVLADIANVEWERITRDTSLFHLGLDSISAIKVSYALKKRSVALPVSKMVEALTVGKMAFVAKPLEDFNNTGPARHQESISVLPYYQDTRQRLEQLGIEDDQVEDIFPCTAGQQFFLGMWQASAAKLFYPAFCYRITGPSISRQTIDAAWQKLRRAIPILRTVFLSNSIKGTSIFQLVLKEATNPVVWPIDRSINAEDAESIPVRGPQPPVMLLAEEHEDGALVTLRIHHALYDGVSLPRMMDAFRYLCDNLALYHTLNSDLSTYVRHLQTTVTRERQRSFWTSYLDGCQSCRHATPPSFTSPRLERFRPGLLNDLRPVQQKLKENGISFQAYFFAAYALLQARLTSFGDAREVIAGVYLANRSLDYEVVAELVAPTANVVPLRIPISGQNPLLENARIVQDHLGKISLIENCTVSLSDIHGWTGLEIDCYMNFLRLPDLEAASNRVGGQVSIGEVRNSGQLPSPGAHVEEWPSPFVDGLPQMGKRIYQPSIDVEVAIRDGGLDVGIFASVDLLDEKQAETLLEELRLLLIRGEY